MQYSSLKRTGFKKKEKKPIAEWKQDLLARQKHTPTRADRAEFPAHVVKELMLEAGGMCQCGCGRPDTETHHVMPRTRGGRGVKTNGMRVNGECNQRFHDNEEELQYWISRWEILYGEYFYFDAEDWEAHEKKQSDNKRAEDEKRQRMEQLDPIINLLSAATDRKLNAKEVRLLNNMDDREMVVFVKLMRDVVQSTLGEKPELPFGYNGLFDD